MRAFFVDLFGMSPSPVRWRIALEGAIAIAVPTMAFALAGRAQLGLVASAGSFLALYLTDRSRRERARLLPLVALAFLASAGLGVVASTSPLGTLVVLCAVAGASSALCLGFGLGPPGAFFFVLVAGIGGYVTAPTVETTIGIDGLETLGLLLVGLALAYAVVLAPLVIAANRAADATVVSAPMRFGLALVDRVVIGRLVVATVVAALAAALLGVTSVHWVIVAVVAILQNGYALRATVVRGTHRVIGTVVGVAAFAVIQVAHPTGIWLGLTLAALLFTIELVVIRNYGLALVFITPLALLVSPGYDGAIVDRIADTLLGATTAAAVLLAAYLTTRGRAHEADS